MKKTFNFGKVDWYGRGRKVNECELEVELKDGEEGKCLSVCGSVWNSKGTDIVAGGQCLDDMLPFLKGDKTFVELYGYWKDFHLNDMKAGSPRQEAAVKAWSTRRAKAGKRYDYTEACEMLKRKGLLDDKEYLYKGRPYRYGEAWLFSAIPAGVLERLEELLK